jgi:phage gpG-like protein
VSSSSGGFRSQRFGANAGGALTALLNEAHVAKDKSLAVLAATLVRQVKLYLSFPGKGREYRRGKKRVHVASAPGHPPAVDTGKLRGSIATERLGPAQYRVGTNVEYASYLEFGTVGPEHTGGHVLPRPFFRPALKSVRLWWNGKIASDLRDAGRRAADRG